MAFHRKKAAAATAAIPGFLEPTGGVVFAVEIVAPLFRGGGCGVRTGRARRDMLNQQSCGGRNLGREQATFSVLPPPHPFLQRACLARSVKERKVLSVLGWLGRQHIWPFVLPILARL